MSLRESLYVAAWHCEKTADRLEQSNAPDHINKTNELYRAAGILRELAADAEKGKA
jgi:hypothetical protein